jgi:hypothetical protein
MFQKRSMIILTLLLLSVMTALIVSCPAEHDRGIDPTVYANLTGDFGDFVINNWTLYGYGRMDGRLQWKTIDHSIDQDITGSFSIYENAFIFSFSGILTDNGTTDDAFILYSNNGTLDDVSGEGNYTLDFENWADINDGTWDATAD